MIAPSRTAWTADPPTSRRPAAPLRLALAVIDAEAAAPRPAPRPRPRRLVAALEGLVCDGVPLADPAATRAALRAFTAGDGFLPGQIVDRVI
jgi:hypothetical protein